ncbi:MAG: hypothetical protein AAF321_11960 [Pseudomonadota bacterium]
MWDPFEPSGRIVPAHPADPDAPSPAALDSVPRYRPNVSLKALAVYKVGCAASLVGLAILITGFVIGSVLALGAGLALIAAGPVVWVVMTVVGTLVGIPGAVRYGRRDKARREAEGEAVRRLGYAHAPLFASRNLAEHIPQRDRERAARERSRAIADGMGCLGAFVPVSEGETPRLRHELWGTLADDLPFWMGLRLESVAALTTDLSKLEDRYGNASQDWVKATVAVGLPLPRDTGIAASVITDPRASEIDGPPTESMAFNTRFRRCVVPLDAGSRTEADGALLALLTPAAQDTLLSLADSHDRIGLAIRGQTVFLLLNERLSTFDPAFLAAYLGHVLARTPDLVMPLRCYLQ